MATSRPEPRRQKREKSREAGPVLATLRNDKKCLTADGIKAFARHDEASKRRRS
jgi:hypothetical protein